MTLQINAHYTSDIKRAYRATMRLRRGAVYRGYVLGVVCMFLAVLAYVTGQPAGLVALFVVFAVVGFLPPVLVWLALRRNRAAIEVEVDVEVTERGISRKTLTQSTDVTWELVQRVIDGGDFWIFVINRLQNVTLYKSLLTPAERAELTAFLASRAGASLRPGTGY